MLLGFRKKSVTKYWRKNVKRRVIGLNISVFRVPEQDSEVQGRGNGSISLESSRGK